SDDLPRRISIRSYRPQVDGCRIIAHQQNVSVHQRAEFMHVCGIPVACSETIDHRIRAIQHEVLFHTVVEIREMTVRLKLEIKRIGKRSSIENWKSGGIIEYQDVRRVRNI